MESLSTQTLVVFLIRTRKTPFCKSKPSIFLLFSSVSVVCVALILPFTTLGALFGFLQPPPSFFLALAGMIGAYLLLVEIVKKWFLKRYSYLLEQLFVVPKKKLTRVR
jgi:Mg2+-importing ATPase